MTTWQKFNSFAHSVIGNYGQRLKNTCFVFPGVATQPERSEGHALSGAGNKFTDEKYGSFMRNAEHFD